MIADTSERIFQVLQTEWQQLFQSRATQKLETWQCRFDNMVHEERELRRQGQWVSGPTDLLSIISQSRREGYHCAILAWLMNPGARHGLGCQFLARLLERCIPPVRIESDRLHTVTTCCEIRKKQRIPDRATRVDIVIEGDGFSVVFEVKIDAGEQPNQCDRIYTEFCANHGNEYFVFFTPTGHPPQTATGAAASAFRCLSFIHVREELFELVTTGLVNRDAGGFATVFTYLETLKKEFS
jgi:hypothetical protein